MITDKKLLQQVIRELMFFFLGTLIGVGLLALMGFLIFRGQIIPGVHVAGLDVGGMTKQEAREVIRTKIEGFEIELVYGDNKWLIPLVEEDIEIEETIDKAYEVGRNLESIYLLDKIIADNLNIELTASSDNVVKEKFSQIIAEVEIEMIPASIAYKNDEIQIEGGRDGIKVDQEKLREDWGQVYQKLDKVRIEMPIKIISASVSPAQKEMIVGRADQLKGDVLKVEYDGESFQLDEEELVGFLSTKDNEVFSHEKILVYVDSLTESVNRTAQNARFAFDAGKVIEFIPHRDGMVLKVDESVTRLEETLNKLLLSSSEEIMQLAVEKVSPNISTEEVNNLGIEELIGRGVSYYRGSIESRVYNVGLAANKLNGLLIAPGEEFSFNEGVGEVSSATGFKSAYIIENGRTVLGDGGGVCQDSTTLFRAALDAGLPITERWAHAYRVGYYEQNSEPGFDATVFSPSKDLKFINDTPAHILIQATAYEQNRKLVIELYGKSDGRESYISEARVWDVTPPPPDLYQDDPSLPAGTIKQVDWSAWGAKAEFDYRVVREGTDIFTETYFSNFRPWQNVYLRGTGGE